MLADPAWTERARREISLELIRHPWYHDMAAALLAVYVVEGREAEGRDAS